MKVCIPATDETPDALVDASFGRCKILQFADTETGKFYYRENTFRQENSGAGTQVAQQILSEGVKVVLSREVGSKAAKVLGVGSVEIYAVGEIPVSEAFDLFKQGALELVN
jgi:predicted Fe-Mo cluster-binding NifX family protein